MTTQEAIHTLRSLLVTNDQSGHQLGAALKQLAGNALTFLETELEKLIPPALVPPAAEDAQAALAKQNESAAPVQETAPAETVQ